MKTMSAVVVAIVAAATLAVAGQTKGVAERFTAMAVNMERGGAGTIEMVVNRWSTEAERNRLMTTLLEKGPEKLLDVLQDMPRVGYIRSNGGLGYDLHYAHRAKGEDGGERIVLATDRRIGFWEASRQPRSIDYPFTVIELRVNNDGEGVGKMSLATKITADKDRTTVTLENYDTQPVLLQSVKRQRASD
jgi:hypothetical protein